MAIIETGERRSARRSRAQSEQLQATSQLGDDYPLRFAPRHYRTWTPAAVAGSALGGMAYLADFSIGAAIGIAHGSINAIGGILVAAVLIFLSSLPLAIYAAKFNIDLDLITRGSGLATMAPSLPMSSSPPSPLSSLPQRVQLWRRG